MRFRKLGIVARFKPLHNGGALMLEALCENAEHVVIGLGSCNKYNVRNPFTADESREMVEAFLKPRFSNYSFVYVPDFAHIPEFRDGRKWHDFVVEHFGSLDAFVSGNDYVLGLMKNSYNVVRPTELIPPEKQHPVCGTIARIEMARHGNWKPLVPAAVADYLESHGLVERFRQEFGIETLAQLASGDCAAQDDYTAERLHTFEG